MLRVSMPTPSQSPYPQNSTPDRMGAFQFAPYIWNYYILARELSRQSMV
jgi:hypothetical protein